MIDKKIGGKDLPTEVFLKKKSTWPILCRGISTEVAVVAFYKEKQRRLGKSEESFVAAITISPAEGMRKFYSI